MATRRENINPYITTMIVVLITLSIRIDSFYLLDGLMSIYRFDGDKLGILKIFALSTFGRKKMTG